MSKMFGKTYSLSQEQRFNPMVLPEEILAKEDEKEK
jgi:hypothetical protein